MVDFVGIFGSEFCWKVIGESRRIYLNFAALHKISGAVIYWHITLCEWDLINIITVLIPISLATFKDTGIHVRQCSTCNTMYIICVNSFKNTYSSLNAHTKYHKVTLSFHSSHIPYSQDCFPREVCCTTTGASHNPKSPSHRAER